jgi:hypothetical protein
VPTRSRPWAVLGVLAFVYFLLYPQDLAAVLRPVEQVLGLSTAVSPWLYGVVAVAILCWTALRIWGGRPARTNAAEPQGLLQSATDRADG